jgi:putative transposase
MSPRLFNHDYSQPGFYFITICIQQHRSRFGKILDQQVHLTELGKIAQDRLQTLPTRFNNITLHEFVIMPNHMHALIELLDTNTKTPLHEIVRTYKALTSHDIHRLPTRPWFAWQENFYDRIVRGEKELTTYRTYILNNPAKWQQDTLYRRY